MISKEVNMSMVTTMAAHRRRVEETAMTKAAASTSQQRMVRLRRLPSPRRRKRRRLLQGGRSHQTRARATYSHFQEESTAWPVQLQVLVGILTSTILDARPTPSGAIKVSTSSQANLDSRPLDSFRVPRITDILWAETWPSKT